MLEAAKDYITQLGYRINDNAHAVIQVCDDWYRAKETPAHRRTTVNGANYKIERMGFGRRMAADDANLCEVVEINAGGGKGAQYDFVKDLLEKNRFDTQYRRQLELTSAEGTAACYVYLEGGEVFSDGVVRGGNIRLNYVDALGFVPLTVENGDVTEAAFMGESFEGTKEITTLVLCRRDESGLYSYEVRVFDENGQLLPERSRDAKLGDVKPFAVMRTAQVNTFDDMQGYGFPKLHDAIPLLMGLDAAFTALMGDIDTAEKIVLINEMLCQFDDKGKAIPPNEQMKRRFVLFGEKLPQDKDMVHEIVPEIRVEKFRDTIELLLGMLSQQFGYGSRKYTLDRDSGVVMTATQYVGERQDMLQELNRQRFEAAEYIRGIVRAALWFANAYQGGGWNIDAEVLVEFDDSYITNKAEQLESMRNDVLSGIGGAYVRQQYLMMKYNLDEKEAARWAMLEDPDAAEETED